VAKGTAALPFALCEPSPTKKRSSGGEERSGRGLEFSLRYGRTATVALSLPGEPGAGKKVTCALLGFSVSLQMPHAFVNFTSGVGFGLLKPSKLLPPVPQTMDVSPPVIFLPVLSRAW
jgi:hypothetical protein